MFTEEDEEPQEVTNKSAAGVDRVRAGGIDACRSTNSSMEGDARKSSNNLGEEAPFALMLPCGTFLCPKVRDSGSSRF